MIYLDFETYSECDLKLSGAYRYSIDPTTEILCMGFLLPGQKEVKLWTPENGCDLSDLGLYISMGVPVTAHNSFFESCIWNNVGIEKYRFPAIEYDQWRCTAAKARALALPGKLEQIAKIIGCEKLKDEKGKSLLKQLSRPRKPTKTDTTLRYDKQTYEQKYQSLYDYCQTDVMVTAEIDQKLPNLSPFEHRVWQLDQTINSRGVYIDKEAVDKVLFLIDNLIEDFEKETFELTNGAVDKVSKRAKVLEWCASHGVDLELYRAEYVSEKLREENLPDTVRRILEIRQETGKASTAKYTRMKSTISPKDNRIRDTLIYHRASTGRWGGQLVQFQNLPRGNIKDMEEAVVMIKNGDIDDIKKYCEGKVNVFGLFSSCLRGMIQSAPGKDLLVADYSSIEARVVAWLSGQNDLVKGFRNGAKIYEEQAAFTFNKPIESITKDSFERFVGKEQVLGGGFQMGKVKFGSALIGKIKQYADVLIKQGWKIDDCLALITDDFCELAIKRYREKNHMIAKQWKIQENAAIHCVQNKCDIKAGKVTWKLEGNFLYCELPSKRRLAYFNPSVERDPKFNKDTLYFYGQKSSKGAEFWWKQSAYGGLLVENITQAIARDIMANAMLNCEAKDYKIILCIHDELIAEVDEGFGDLGEFKKIMCDIPRWAQGLPVAVGDDAWRGKRYKK